jgi:hypothetical protein
MNVEEARGPRIEKPQDQDLGTLTGNKIKFAC